MANEKLFYVGVKGLIRNKEGKILLLKSSLRNHTIEAKPYWDIPGGRIEKGQDALSTLKREIKEETDLSKISDVQFFSSIISNHEILIGEAEKAGLVLMVYTLEIPGGSKIVLSPEHTEYQWVSNQKAAKRLADKYPKEFTDKILN